MGPPCETWTKARAAELLAAWRAGESWSWTHELGRPRLLRLREFPWGMQHLTLREHRQCLVGSRLLQFALRLMVHAYFSCVGTLLEHPEDPEEDFLSSIWRIWLLQLFQQLPGNSIHHICQSWFGAVSLKPARLFAVHMGLLASRLDQYADYTNQGVKERKEVLDDRQMGLGRRIDLRSTLVS